MIQNRQNKQIKFHKVNFKNAKRYNRNKLSNKLISLKINQNSSSNNNEKEKSFNLSDKNCFLKNIEDKYSIFKNKNLIKHPKRNYSTNNFKDNIFNNFLLRQNDSRKEGTNGKSDGNHELPLTLKIGPINKGLVKYNSCKGVKQNKCLLKTNKDLISLEIEQNTINNNKLNKDKKRKKGKRCIRNEKNRHNKEITKINNVTYEKENYEILVKKNNHLFCCL